MNNLSKKLQEASKHYALTKRERRLLWSNISGKISPRPVRSPYWSVFFIRGTVALLIVVLVSGGTAFASGNALPGDALYPVKVSVVEPLGEAFIVSEDDKISYNESLIARRIKEAQKLADETRFSENARRELEKELEKRAEKAQKLAEKVRERDQEKAERLAEEFESVLIAHGDILEELAKESGSEETRGSAHLLASSLREGRYRIWRSETGTIALKERASEDAREENQSEESASLALMSAPAENADTTESTETHAASLRFAKSGENEESLRTLVSEEAKKRAWKLYEEVKDEFDDARNLEDVARKRIENTLENLNERLEKADTNSLPLIIRELLRLQTFIDASNRLRSRDIMRPLFADDENDWKEESDEREETDDSEAEQDEDDDSPNEGSGGSDDDEDDSGSGSSNSGSGNSGSGGGD